MSSASVPPKGAKPPPGKPAPGKATPKKASTKKATPKKGGFKLQAAAVQAIKSPGAKAHVFLVAVKRRREALRVYAVLTASEAVALAIVEAAGGEDVTVEPVGRLSKKLARPLKLLTGEPYPI